MPPLSVLIKPASSACNMNCAYCFYKDIASKREKAFEGMLNGDLARKIVEGAMEFAEGCCSFMFQGGEPTLAGLDFFENFIRLEKEYAKKGVTICNAIQTNGLNIDDDWAEFFRKNDFLVGLSLDGSADMHNPNRDGTFNRVIRAARILEKHRVRFNILCVVTSRTARSANKLYNFFTKQKFGYLQFIPCLEPLGECRESAAFVPSVEEYKDFLIRIFDLWYADLLKGNYISIRHIDNWISVALYGRAENCGMNGHCSVQFVIEGDGGVYPCDFYVLDKWRMGTVGEQSFEELGKGDIAMKFVEESFVLPEKCKTCSYAALCRNGCRRDRLLSDGRNYYCEAYYGFFRERIGELQNAVGIVRRIMGK